MRLELEILDGANKGQRIALKNGLVVGKTVDSLHFDDESIAELHAMVSLDQKKQWNIDCLGVNKIRLGFEEVSHARLIFGLIFNLGQTGFKVVQNEGRVVTSWQKELKTWLENNPGPRLKPDLVFFLKPIRLSFILGPQYEEVYTLSYGPREIGFNNLDLNIKDPTAPTQVARFFQVSDQTYIENLCGSKATINGQPFDQHPVTSGDKLKVASNVIELSLL